MGIFNSLFGKRSSELKEVLQNGATIVDVRSAAEFSGGHVEGSINVPLDQVEHKIKKLKQLKTPLVLCCASGMRSANATNILRSNKFDKVYNGGSWSKVERLLKN